jgi:dolichol-phosphate mannosyltransferase
MSSQPVGLRSGCALVAGWCRSVGVRAPRFIRFGVVGCLGTLVNMIILYLLVHYGGWNQLAAAVVATEGAIGFNFVMNDSWTFRQPVRRHSWISRAWRYNIIAISGAAISLTVLCVLTYIGDVHYLVANLTGIAAATVWNYFLNMSLTWRSAGATGEAIKNMS